MHHRITAKRGPWSLVTSWARSSRTAGLSFHITASAPLPQTLLYTSTFQRTRRTIISNSTASKDGCALTHVQRSRAKHSARGGQPFTIAIVSACL